MQNKRTKILNPDEVRFEIENWLTELKESDCFDVQVHEHVLKRFDEHLVAVLEDFG